MTDLDLDALEATARAATPGPWAIWHDLDHQGFRTVGDAESYAEILADGQTDDANPTAHVYTDDDAQHIAAFDPPTVLALIARLRTAESVVKDYDANFPCDGGCNVNDGPEETCSRHGRSPSDLWERVENGYRAAARLREAEAVLAEIRVNAAELLDADDDSYDGSLSATWVVELIAAYQSTKTENTTDRENGSER